MQLVILDHHLRVLLPSAHGSSVVVLQSMAGFTATLQSVVAFGHLTILHSRRKRRIVTYSVNCIMLSHQFGYYFLLTTWFWPTNLREKKLGFTKSWPRQAMVLGGAFSMMLIAVGRSNKWFSFGMFCLIATCGCFVVFLPETNGRTFSDRMDEEEDKDKTFVC